MANNYICILKPLTHLQSPALASLRVQKWVAFISVILFIVKITAYFLTGSVAILTDALESIANIIAGFIGWYSLYVAAKPRDQDHPYGHGKAEYISAAAEGVLITAAGLLVIYEAVKHLFYAQPLQKVDWGIALVAAAALVNYIVGAICLRTGRNIKSLALTASGKHLQSDTYTTLGIIAGLVLLLITHIRWIDSAVALLFGGFIVFTGFTILRSSVEGIMDKADDRLLKEVIATLQQHRGENWTDLHNLRILKYGHVLHLDCHLTVPWYLNVTQAHKEVERLDGLVKQQFGQSVELFVHTDACLPFSCAICQKQHCAERQHPFEKTIVWTMENVVSNQKHRL
jgi:cation diffusion facilitator family transporter